LLRVKLNKLLDCPPTVTTTLPVVAPVGTGVTMLVLLHDVGTAAAPLNVTEPELPKFVPVTVTSIPIPAGFGEIEVMYGLDCE
jgi:hypothetical protein